MTYTLTLHGIAWETQGEYADLPETFSVTEKDNPDFAKMDESEIKEFMIDLALVRGSTKHWISEFEDATLEISA